MHDREWCACSEGHDLVEKCRGIAPRIRLATRTRYEVCKTTLSISTAGWSLDVWLRPQRASTAARPGRPCATRSQGIGPRSLCAAGNSPGAPSPSFSSQVARVTMPRVCGTSRMCSEKTPTPRRPSSCCRLLNTTSARAGERCLAAPRPSRLHSRRPCRIRRLPGQGGRSPRSHTGPCREACSPTPVSTFPAFKRSLLLAGAPAAFADSIVAPNSARPAAYRRSIGVGVGHTSTPSPYWPHPSIRGGVTPALADQSEPWQSLESGDLNLRPLPDQTRPSLPPAALPGHQRPRT
jgi:hypothetical protein